MAELGDIIGAAATAYGEGAIAMVRISGRGAVAMVSRLLSGRSPFESAQPKMIGLYSVNDPVTGKSIDHITAIRYASPASYTGEEMVELFCHGGKYVVESILSLLFRAGVRLAHPGEFTRRAFLNGKIDLLRAEAIPAIIKSRSSVEHENAVDMYLGNSGKAIIKLRDATEDALVDIESMIEFGEEDDVAGTPRSEVFKKIAAIIEALQKELAARQRSKRIEKGLVVAIIGETNAGKSSLFNAILDYDRSIVHSSAGTTRDFISEDVFIGRTLVTIIDTAGIRNSDNEVEAIGIKKSWDYVNSADLVIFMTSAEADTLSETDARILQKCQPEKTVAIISKHDLSPSETKIQRLKERGIDAVGGTVVTESGRAELLAAVASRVERVAGRFSGSAFVINSRQEGLLSRVLASLKPCIVNSTIAEEVAAEHLRESLRLFDELLGATTTEQILDQIFSRFCIGK